MPSILLDSLRNRIRAMNTLYERAVTDMTLDQVNHHERAGVLPIAFSLSHFIRAQDQTVSALILRKAVIWDTDGWAKKVGVTVDRLGREETVEEMEAIRFGDFEAWQEYQSQVLAQTRDAMDGLTDESLEEVLLPKLPPFPDESYKAGARIFPTLVPTSSDDPAVPANRKAWEALLRWGKPFLTTFSDSDAITKGGERAFQGRVLGMKGQPHTTIEGADHFLQVGTGPELDGTEVHPGLRRRCPGQRESRSRLPIRGRTPEPDRWI